MKDIIKALGFLIAIVVFVISLINQVPLTRALGKTAIVIVLTYTGGFLLYLISVIILQNAQPKKVIEESKNPEVESV